MRALEKIELLESIGTELQSRMTFSEIDTFFTAYGIDYSDIEPSANSKRIYAREVLAREPEETILSIASELGIEHSFSRNLAREATFWKPGYFRLFLSHLATFKVQTSRLQTALLRYGITSFVAHEDIEPTREWQNEIELALHSMDALVAILMDGFKESNWCDQEVGVAVGRDVLVIPVRKGLDPYGFIGKYQGIQASNRTVGEVAEQIYSTLISSQKTREKMIGSLLHAISQETVIEDAISKVQLLRSVENMPINLLDGLKERVLENHVLKESSMFISELNGILTPLGVSELIVNADATTDDWDEIPF